MSLNDEHIKPTSTKEDGGKNNASVAYFGALEIGEIKADLIIKMTEEGKEKELEKAEEGKKRRLNNLQNKTLVLNCSLALLSTPWVVLDKTQFPQPQNEGRRQRDLKDGIQFKTVILARLPVSPCQAQWPKMHGRTSSNLYQQEKQGGENHLGPNSLTVVSLITVCVSNPKTICPINIKALAAMGRPLGKGNLTQLLIMLPFRKVAPKHNILS